MPIFEPVFSALNEAGVRYVVVGGLAVVLHGYPRYTADLDIVRDPMPFEGLWSRSRSVDLGSLKVQVASIDDLIVMKRAVGRPQDLADIEALEALKKRGAKKDSGV